MTEYVIYNFNVFVPEKDIKDTKEVFIDMPDKDNYTKTRPFRSGSLRESAPCEERKNSFQNREPK